MYLETLKKLFKNRHFYCQKEVRLLWCKHICVLSIIIFSTIGRRQKNRIANLKFYTCFPKKKSLNYNHQQLESNLQKKHTSVSLTKWISQTLNIAAKWLFLFALVCIGRFFRTIYYSPSSSTPLLLLSKHLTHESLLQQSDSMRKRA